MRENRIETRLVLRCKDNGALAVKLASPGMAGLPDRLVLKDGRAWFVELKAPGEKPRKLQERCHRILKDHGFEVLVLDSLDGVEKFVREVIQ